MTFDRNFKMKRSTKTLLALGKFKDEHVRGAFKRAMIGAQKTEEESRRNALKSKEKSRESD